MKIHNKLVRDRIPEIIRQDGRTCVVRTLGDDEYQECLDAKLQEELREYLFSGELEELADMLEVIYAILEVRGVSMERLEEIRSTKQIGRGAFKKRIFLESVHPR